MPQLKHFEYEDFNSRTRCSCHLKFRIVQTSNCIQSWTGFASRTQQRHSPVCVTKQNFFLVYKSPFKVPTKVKLFVATTPRSANEKIRNRSDNIRKVFEIQLIEDILRDFDQLRIGIKFPK